jgi:hypothetical protein
MSGGRTSVQVWVIQTRSQAGGTWSDWRTLTERELSGADADPATPMAPRAWAACTYYFGDKSPAPDVGFRLWNTHTNEADPNDPFE